MMVGQKMIIYIYIYTDKSCNDTLLFIGNNRVIFSDEDRDTVKRQLESIKKLNTSKNSKTKKLSILFLCEES